jgi:hypothetical protein
VVAQPAVNQPSTRVVSSAALRNEGFMAGFFYSFSKTIRVLSRAADDEGSQTVRELSRREKLTHHLFPLSHRRIRVSMRVGCHFGPSRSPWDSIRPVGMRTLIDGVDG